MNRIVMLELAGEKYPLLFSMQALIEICEKYGSLKEALDLMSSDPAFQVQFDMAVVLSKSGADYMKLKKEAAPQLTAEQLTFANPFEIGAGKLYAVIISCIEAGAKQTVEAEESPKNAETAQE